MTRNVACSTRCDEVVAQRQLVGAGGVPDPQRGDVDDGDGDRDGRRRGGRVADALARRTRSSSARRTAGEAAQQGRGRCAERRAAERRRPSAGGAGPCAPRPATPLRASSGETQGDAGDRDGARRTPRAASVATRSASRRAEPRRVDDERADEHRSTRSRIPVPGRATARRRDGRREVADERAGGQHSEVPMAGAARNSTNSTNSPSSIRPGRDHEPLVLVAADRRSVTGHGPQPPGPHGVGGEHGERRRPRRRR